MARIEPVSPERLAALAAEVQGWKVAKGYAPNAWLTMAHRPRVFLAFRNLHTAVMIDEGEVPRALKFMIAEVVSRAAGCTYCTAHNAENAVHITGVPLEKVQALGSFQSSRLFGEAERAALALAAAAGSCPPEVTDDHFTRLRRHYSEEAMAEIVAVISLFGWLNRWNQTLATQLEDQPRSFMESLSALGDGAA
jgi:uncharacterized peroxidase-related enzyme